MRINGKPASDAGALTALVAADGSTGGFIKDSQAGNLPATATNDSASAGNVGEYIESIILAASRVTLTSGTPADITSISLTAGDWDVSGLMWQQFGAGSTCSYMAVWVSATSATIPTAPAGGLTQLQATITGNSALATSVARFSLANTTTIYFSTIQGFAVNPIGAYGILRARRVR